MLHRFLLIGLLAVVFSACSTSHGEERKADNVKVEELRLIERRDGSGLVTGMLHNTNSSDLRLAEVEVSLFDVDNQRVGTVRIQVEKLPAGERQRFREVVEPQLNVKGARVRQIMVF